MDCISEHLFIPLKDLEVHEILGEGSFGAVFKGIWNGRGGGTLVAIKKVRAEERDTIEYLCKELNVMASLRFQNICQVHGGCVVSDMEVWFVLEYVEGGNLHDFLHSSTQPLPFSLQINFALQAAKAVNYLHSGPAPLLHRDIKSLNFLINEKTEKLLLTDFGLSQIKDTIPQNCTTIGTLRWAAPEVLTDYPYWSEKADIFGLGLVFYEIASREIPFKKEKSFYTIEKHIKDNVRPEIPAECPQVFADIIQRCWDPVPSRRPSAHELICLLRNISDPPRFSTAVPSKSIEIIKCAKVEIGSRRNSIIRTRASSIIAMHRGSKSEDYTQTIVVQSRPRSTICVSESGLQHSRELEYTPLHWAVESNDYKEVEEVIKNGGNIEEKDTWGRTPLHLAASIGNIYVVMTLIEAGSDLESVTKLGETPLHIASLYGNVRTITELVLRGANMESVAKDGYTPLSKAVSLGNVKSTRELLRLGAKQEKTKERESLFHLASKSGHCDEILIELAKWWNNINEIDDKGETALHKAAESGRIKIVKELIKMGANIELLDENGETAIYKAAKRGHGEIIKELVENGAKTRVMFQLALANGNTKTMESFLEYGKINLGEKDKRGNTYLHIASLAGYSEIVKILIQKGMKIDEISKDGLTAWDLAKMRGHKNVEIILEEASNACVVQ